MNFWKTFLADETGAVTVDWVVLTAGVVGIAITFMTPISSAISDLAKGIGEKIGVYKAYLEYGD